ncbi:50S ribosomal protein L25 [Brevibacillus massiliensis]|uniref:50S ribosomal protein L25 n=1 Tax=Brevibacillus massiliensis TaxID=1118054 RepID=UPI000474CA53|nr:50S ribosomal protein L25 [Brevibacillus massiliensis]
MKTITAEKRALHGKSGAKKIRKAGRVPGVLYGADQESQLLQVDGRQLVAMIRANGINRPFRLKVGAAEVPVMIAEMQQKPMLPDILHIDFKQINMNQGISASVPLVLTGKPDSGQAMLHAHEITVNCLPSDIPAELPISVEGLHVGDTVTVADLKGLKNVEILQEPGAVLVTIVEAMAAADNAGEEAEE